MNARLIELAKQAGITSLSPVEEKFAELVAQECKDLATWVGRMPTAAVKPDDMAYAARMIATRIDLTLNAFWD